MLIGYACVSTQDQNLELQPGTLKAAGCDQIFDDKMKAPKQPGLASTKPCATCAGDILIIWKLSRLGQSLRQLIDTAS